MKNKINISDWLWWVAILGLTLALGTLINYLKY